MSNAYKSTTVPIARSQEAIRGLLLAFGVRGVQFSEDFEERRVSIRFAKAVNGNLRTVMVTMIVPEAPVPKQRQRGHYHRGRFIRAKTQDERQEQMARATYRALHDWLKAQFVAVDYGLLSFEQVFLAHFEWMFHGKETTVGEVLLPMMERPGAFMLEAPKARRGGDE